MHIIELAIEGIGAFSLLAIVLGTVAAAVLVRKGDNIGPWG